jgi:hypothetical protein
VAGAKIGLRLNPKVHDPLLHHIMMLEKVRQHCPALGRERRVVSLERRGTMRKSRRNSNSCKP